MASEPGDLIRWAPTHDPKTCSICAEMLGMRERELDAIVADRCAPLVHAIDEAIALVSQDLPAHAIRTLEDALDTHREREVGVDG